MSLSDMKLVVGGPPNYFVMGMVGRWVGCQPVTNNNTRVEIKQECEEELSISFQKLLANVIEIHRYYFLFPDGEPLPLPFPVSRTGLACPAADLASYLLFCFSLLLSF